MNEDFFKRTRYQIFELITQKMPYFLFFGYISFYMSFLILF